MTALDAGTGNRAWREAARSDDDAPLAGVRGGVVYVADTDRNVEGYAVATGARTLHFRAARRVNDLDVRGGRAFAASDDGAVYGLK